jgi:hypothetical protein
MERRKFVIGLGSLAAGGAAAMGTGAFTSAVVPREGDINVANDSNAFLQLEAGGARGVGQRVGQNGSGELYIDLDEDAGGDGVNDQSKYQLGAMNDSATGDEIDFMSLYDSDSTPGAAGTGEPWVDDGSDDGVDQSAFVVHNQSGQTLDLQIGLNSGSGSPGAVLYLQGKATAIAGGGEDSQLDGATQTRTTDLDLSDPTESQDDEEEALSFNNDGEGADEAIPAGESVYVSFQVDTTEAQTEDGISLAEELTISANEAADPGGEAETEAPQ